MSSATNEVVILNRGMLKSFDIMLKTETETPDDANSNGPSDGPNQIRPHSSTNNSK